MLGILDRGSGGSFGSGTGGQPRRLRWDGYSTQLPLSGTSEPVGLKVSQPLVYASARFRTRDRAEVLLRGFVEGFCREVLSRGFVERFRRGGVAVSSALECIDRRRRRPQCCPPSLLSSSQFWTLNYCSWSLTPPTESACYQTYLVQQPHLLAVVAPKVSFITIGELDPPFHSTCHGFWLRADTLSSPPFFILAFIRRLF